MRSSTLPISSEFRGGGVEHPKPPLGTPLLQHDNNILFEKSSYNRAQDKRRKNEAEPMVRRRIDALEETSSEQLELPGSNSVMTQNIGI